MQFQTRSKAQVVSDLATKLLQLPARHPNRPTLLRMIEGLREELREHERGVGNRTRTGHETQQSFPLIERRRFPRRRALLGAQIVFRGGLCSMDCYIVGVSEGGATLRPDDPIVCPKEFILKPRLEPPRECEVVWRRGGLFGVRYERPYPVTAQK